MAAAETSPVPRRNLETQLIEKCWKDPEFKKRVVTDPKGMFERHTGKKLPPEVKIFIHEEDPRTLHLVIPPAPANLTELSDDDLEKVAGGTELVVSVSLLVTGVMSVVTVSAGVTAEHGW